MTWFCSCETSCCHGSKTTRNRADRQFRRIHNFSCAPNYHRSGSHQLMNSHSSCAIFANVCARRRDPSKSCHYFGLEEVQLLHICFWIKVSLSSPPRWRKRGKRQLNIREEDQPFRTEIGTSSGELMTTTMVNDMYVFDFSPQLYLVQKKRCI